MANTMAAKYGGCQMIRISCFTTVRTQDECIKTPTLPPDVKGRHVSKEVVNPMCIGRILEGIPLFSSWIFPVEAALLLAFIVHCIETNYSLQKDVQLRMVRRVLGDLKQWLEDIDD